MNHLKLGFGKADFTPDGPVWLNSTVYGDKITEPLYANCLAWQDEELTVLQLSLDIRNIYDRFYNLARETLSKTTGIPEEQILISVTHNHSSPDIIYFDRKENEDWIYRIGIPAICEAAKNALEDLTPATTAKAGRSQTHKVAFVRRYFREDGTLSGIASPKSDSPLVAHESEADPELRAVLIDREGKKPIVLINFQTHAAHQLSTHKGTVGSDFVGYMRETIEKEMDVIPFYCQGACGNVNTFTRLEEEKEGWPEHYYAIGESIGKSVIEALENASLLPLGKLKLYFGELECTVNHAKSHLAAEAKIIVDETDPEAKKALLAKSEISSKYEASAIYKRSLFDKTKMMPLASLTCGEFAQGFAPVELFDVCGKSFRDASPFEMTFFCGYSLGSHNYMPSATAFPNGGYEVLQCHYVPGTGERIALELGRQLAILKKK